MVVPVAVAVCVHAAEYTPVASAEALAQLMHPAEYGPSSW